MITILSEILGSFYPVIAGIAITLLALFGINLNAKRTAERELSGEIRARIMESLGDAKEIDDDSISLTDDDVRDRMRDKGWIRE